MPFEKINFSQKFPITPLTRGGTGKTYASAFAMRELGFKKVLFLVHREQILKQALISYKKVLPGNISMGLLSGNYKDTDVDYLFSTVQTMSRSHILEKFEKDRFECIIIDETHKAGAESYHRIIKYFTPKFLLGMTASPERTDGFDIYSLFDHNIASEIRLQDALRDNLLCPFHYYGISDLEINGQTIDDHADFRLLANEQRVNYILEQAEYYGCDGERVKGLVFCSRNEEAKALSEEFKKELDRLIEYGLLRYKDIYARHDDNNMVLYEKYSRKDVCRLMNWDKDESSTMYGYRIKHNTCPIFVTYEKKEDISDSTKYEDTFIDNRFFSWMTRNGVSLDSRESVDIINYKKTGLKICLFIKKSDGEGMDFYYMGEAEPVQWRETTIQNNKGKILPIVNFVFRLKNSVREDIYEYLTK